MVQNGQVYALQVLYPNGNKETETQFVNGLAQGVSTGFYPNGKKRSEFVYEKG